MTAALLVVWASDGRSLKLSDPFREAMFGQGVGGCPAGEAFCGQRGDGGDGGERRTTGEE
jgi:hypothetical protein